MKPPFRSTVELHGERTLVIGNVAVREPPRTLMLLWGDWVRRAAAAFLVLLAATAALRKGGTAGEREAAPSADAAALPADLAVLPRAARLGAGLLRTFSRGGLLWMIAAVLLGEGALQANTLAQIRTFAAIFLAPEAAARCVLRAFAARASIAHERLGLAALYLDLPAWLLVRVFVN